MGWNGSNLEQRQTTQHEGRGKNGGKTAFPYGRLVLLFIVLIGVCMLAYLSLNHDKGEQGPAEEARAKKVEKQIPSKSPSIKSRETTDPQPATTPTNVVRRWGNSSNVPSSDTNRVHKATMDAVRVVDADGVVHSLKSTPIFKTRIDNMLWAAVRPGGMPSGLNALRSRMRFQTGSDAAFLEALRKQDITIEQDDPPHVVAAKEETIAIKKEIVDALDSGRTFDDIYKEISETTRTERMYERITQEDMRRMMQAGDAAAIRKYVEEMNPVMEAKGLKRLRVPSWALEDGSTKPTKGK